MNTQLDLKSINLDSFLSSGGLFSKALPIDQLVRLHPLLTNTDSDLLVEVTIIREKQEQILMTLTITGALVLNCSRCVGPFQTELNIIQTLELFNDAIDMGNDREFEPIIMKNGHFNLIDILSDELLLSLPSRHTDECERDLIHEFSDNFEDANDGTINPFASLDKMFK